MRSLVLDISFYQDNPDTSYFVDFEIMKQSGVDGVILRIGQNLWEDKKFGEYWKNSEAKGILRGGYWYYDNRISPENQAEKCASIIKKYAAKFDLPVFADFEDNRVGSEFPYMGWNNWYRFLTKLESLLPNVRLGVYTGYYYFLENAPKIQSQRDYFGKYPLWIAQYPYSTHMSSEYYNEPFIPTNTWKEWMFWQVSDRGDGRFHGVESSRVDINYYNGTKEDLEREFGIPDGIPPIIIPPVENEIKKEIILSYGDKRISYESGE